MINSFEVKQLFYNQSMGHASLLRANSENVHGGFQGGSVVSVIRKKIAVKVTSTTLYLGYVVDEVHATRAPPKSRNAVSKRDRQAACVAAR